MGGTKHILGASKIVCATLFPPPLLEGATKIFAPPIGGGNSFLPPPQGGKKFFLPPPSTKTFRRLCVVVSNATGRSHAWTRNLLSTEISLWFCDGIFYAIITPQLIVAMPRGPNRHELCNATLAVRGEKTALSCFSILLFYFKKHFQS